MNTVNELNHDPGIHENVPREQYAKWPGYNYSSVKAAAHSLRRYRWERDTRYAKRSSSLDLGAFVDWCVWEPETLPLRVAIWDGDKRGKAYEAFAVANANKLICKPELWSEVLAMRDSIQRDAVAKDMLNSVKQVQPSVIWINPQTGMECKGRLDAILPDCILDLKTTKSHRSYDRDFFNYSYHIQAGAYIEGVTESTQICMPMKHLVVCTEPPYEVVLRPVDDAVADYGCQEWNRLLREIQAAEKSGVWSKAVADNTPILMPSWMVDKWPELTIGGKKVA